MKICHPGIEAFLLLVFAVLLLPSCRASEDGILATVQGGEISLDVYSHSLRSVPITNRPLEQLVSGEANVRYKLEDASGGEIKQCRYVDYFSPSKPHILGADGRIRFIQDRRVLSDAYCLEFGQPVFFTAFIERNGPAGKVLRVYSNKVEIRGAR